MQNALQSALPNAPRIKEILFFLFDEKETHFQRFKKRRLAPSTIGYHKKSPAKCTLQQSV
jgi:hypothetical protein